MLYGVLYKPMALTGRCTNKRTKQNSSHELMCHFSLVYLKGSYDAISSFPSSLECYKLIVYR